LKLLNAVIKFGLADYTKFIQNGQQYKVISQSTLSTWYLQAGALNVLAISTIDL